VANPTKIFSLAKPSGKTFRPPGRVQLIVAGFLWLSVVLAFQSAEVYKEAHYLNTADIVFSGLLMLTAVFFIFILQRYASAYFNNRFTRFGLSGILVFKIVYIEGFLLKQVSSPSYVSVYGETVLLRTFTAFLVVSFFSFLLWMLSRLGKFSEQNAMKQKIESSLRDAELMKLRQQIQPHFLFNSLNSINALVGSEPQQARKMIQNLSEFLRGTLKKDENRPVPLAEEIELLKLYLDIEKVRFGHRLNIIFNIDPQLLEKSIPPLILQPIVENAIKFGLYNILDDVEIKLDGRFNASSLIIEVTNPFDEKTAVTRRGEGFGLSLIQRRLQLIYHRADLLKTEKENGIFKTIIIIPQQ
jgi:sensor histidine kinase YesM